MVLGIENTIKWYWDEVCYITKITNSALQNVKKSNQLHILYFEQRSTLAYLDPFYFNSIT